jgi:hypothetical protein
MLKVEAGRACMLVVADLHNFDEEQDPVRI